MDKIREKKRYGEVSDGEMAENHGSVDEKKRLREKMEIRTREIKGRQK